MKSNPNMSVYKYIELGETILKADTHAIENNEKYALVSTIRSLIHNRLSILKIKTQRLDELVEKYDYLSDDKKGEIKAIKNILKELSVYIENHYFFDRKDILTKLKLTNKLPLDEQGVNDFVTEILITISNLDKRYSISLEILENLENHYKVLTKLIEESNEYHNKKSILVKEREMALDDFREVLPTIRKWLWKMLPDGRTDNKLDEYGFNSYGK